jgi:hypothetical protein
MFPLTLVQYVKLGLCVAVLAFSWYLGFSFSNNRFLEYKADQVTQTQKAQEAHQQAANQIRKDKDAQITSINTQLVDAISQLRSRPSRTQAATNGQGGTGATLSAEDAEFLTREAARADIIRTGLSACYKQYNALTQ